MASPQQLWQPPSVSEVLLASGTPARWFALRVRSNFERTVSTLLEQKGVDRFLPTYRVRRPWADRIKTLDLPLFPGYVFCRIALEEKHSVLATSGVVDIVGAGRTPLPVSEAEMAAIRAVVQSQVAAEPWPFLRIGQRVRIRRGPLAGLEGILIKVKSAYRLVVSISLLERSVAAEIDAAYVSPSG